MFIIYYLLLFEVTIMKKSISKINFSFLFEEILTINFINYFLIKEFTIAIIIIIILTAIKIITKEKPRKFIILQYLGSV
jgi:hypothetical protein